MNMEIKQSKFRQKMVKVKSFFKGVFSRKKKEEAPVVLALEKDTPEEATLKNTNSKLSKEISDGESKTPSFVVENFTPKNVKKEVILSKELEECSPVISFYLKKYGITEEEYKKSHLSIRAALKSAGKLYDQGSRSLSRMSVVEEVIVPAIREKYKISNEEYQYIEEDHPGYVWAMFPAAVDFAEYLEGFGKASKEEREGYVKGKRDAAKVNGTETNSSAMENEKYPQGISTSKNAEVTRLSDISFAVKFNKDEVAKPLTPEEVKTLNEIRSKYSISDEEYVSLRENYVLEGNITGSSPGIPYFMDFKKYLESFGKSSKEERESYLQYVRKQKPFLENFERENKESFFRMAVLDALEKYELSPLYDDAIVPVCVKYSLTEKEMAEAIGFYKWFAVLAIPKKLSVAEHIENYAKSVLEKKPVGK